MWKCVKRERERYRTQFSHLPAFLVTPPGLFVTRGFYCTYLSVVCCVSSLHFSSFVLLTDAEFIILNIHLDGSVCDFMYLAFVLNINFCDIGN